MNIVVKCLVAKARELCAAGSSIQTPWVWEDKFAELLVQECLDVIERSHFGSGDEWDVAVLSVKEDVREHFEVE